MVFFNSAWVAADALQHSQMLANAAALSRSQPRARPNANRAGGTGRNDSDRQRRRLSLHAAGSTPIMSPMMEDAPTPSSQDAFVLLPHGHKDMVGATAFNSYGDRFASSSVDGKIKVYNRHRDGSWALCDTWTAHSAEILEIQWLPPTIHPNLIASIGLDGRFKIWVEDPTVAPLRGRRFNSHSNKAVFELRAPARAPFLSFSIKHNAETRHTYLALLKRNAELTIYENEEPENLENWADIDTFTVCDKPARGEETAFKVQFEPNLEPCYNAIRQGAQRDSLALIVACMNRASIWRTKEISHTVSLGSSTTKEFYLAAELRGHRGLVRDIAWAPGNIRGFDVVATACKDGFVRLFEIRTPEKEGREGSSWDYAKMSSDQVLNVPGQRGIENNNGASRNAPSGIGAGLAGARSGLNRQQEAERKQGEVLHVVKEVSRLEANGTPVWRVEFDDDGQLLGSTGDDGKLMLWRREPSGAWSKSAELAMNRSIPA